MNLKTFYPLLSAFSVISILLLPSHRAVADVTITASESGSNIIMSYSGSLTVPTLEEYASEIETDLQFGTFNPGTPFFSAGTLYTDPGATLQYRDIVASHPGGFGKSGPIGNASFTGDYFSISRDDLGVPEGYQDGQQISASMTFSNTSFSELEIDVTESPFVWLLLNGEKVTLQIGEYITPEPGPTVNLDLARKAAIERKIKKLKKKLKKAKKKGNRKLVKKFRKRVDIQIYSLNGRPSTVID